MGDSYLSSRKKGDLYWKKMKLFLAAARERDVNVYQSRTGKEFANAILLSCNVDSRENEKEPVLTGKEFCQRPVTVAGMRIYEDNIRRALRTEAYYLSKSADSAKEESERYLNFAKEIGRMLDIWFISNAVDRHGKRQINNSNRIEAEHLLQSAAERYCVSVEQFYSKDRNEIQKESYISEQESLYTEKYIYGDDLFEYADYIPINYHEQINRHEIMAVACFNGSVSKENLIGISLYADHMGWFEIIWVSMGFAHADTNTCAAFVSYNLQRARNRNKYIGAFCEIHEDEDTKEHERILTKAGMELTRIKNNMYEFTLSQIVHEDKLNSVYKQAQLIFLEEASDELVDMLLEEMLYDERPVPIPQKFERSYYISDLSVICLDHNAPCGTLLVSEQDGALVIELLYAQTKLSVPAMVGKALARAKEKYTGDTMVLVPIVNPYITGLTEYLAPDAVHGDVVEAVVWY